MKKQLEKNVTNKTKDIEQEDVFTKFARSALRTNME